MIRRVVGQSMLPAYRPGTLVLGVRWLRPQLGRVVIAERDGREIIKRVTDMKAGRVFVLGDNPARSTDSREYGWLELRMIKSVIIGSITR